LHFTCAARTDVGIVRSGNEDNYLMLSDRGVFIVADGMGGHAAGEVASEMAVAIVVEVLAGLSSLPDDDAARAIHEAVRRANEAIYKRTLTETEKHGMGTTVSLLGLHDWHYVIGQVGDSRVYLLREGRLVQLTKDHSYVQEQVDAGALTPEQARDHPYSNVITRCVGAGAEVRPDVYVGAAQAGDTFLVASDGLTGMVDDRRLQQLLGSRAPAQRVVDALIAEANGRGGLDNITAIVVRILRDDEVPRNTNSFAAIRTPFITGASRRR
jgi:protein phosphatase